MNIVFMFPGVGSHYSGMGKDLYENFPVAREIFEEASDTLKIDMASLCMEKIYKADLEKLQNSQTALVTTSMAAFRVFEQEIGNKPEAMIGYSLGEYTALCASGAIAFSDTLKLVQERSTILSSYALTIDGTMAWVNNLAPEIVEGICSELLTKGQEVYISAYDTPNKTSISGTNSAVQLACEMVVEHGGIAIPLKLSGPFHSPMMQPAAEKYKSVLENIDMKQPLVPVIANHDSSMYKGVENIRENLYLQLIKPVKWLDMIHYLMNQGSMKAIEMGPKEVLKYLLQAINPAISTCNYEREKDILNTKNSFTLQESDYEEVISGCLTVVVSTKNYNTDLSDYQKKVVLPFQKVQSQLEEKINSGYSVEKSDVEEAIQMMKTALTEKQIKEREQKRYLQRVLQCKSF
ncbi:malonyl CoA-ACP transacylase [Bacillus cereus]|uniref:ACP S-malonyltransferase n=1 Tax=Bacillus cereus TaxID=1396 RepID=UPI000BF7CEEB|nr:ACP S-malonyltransferase [Bacillus cereus]PFJ95812.1 malonyl CoA-ACP transacylase [Bacillus cereus]